MRRLAVSHAAIGWLGLVALTLASWFMHDGIQAEFVVYALIVFSTAKIYVIGHSFMEVPRSAAAFRRFFALWPAVIGTLFAGVELLTRH